MMLNVAGSQNEKKEKSWNSFSTDRAGVVSLTTTLVSLPSYTWTSAHSGSCTLRLGRLRRVSSCLIRIREDLVEHHITRPVIDCLHLFPSEGLVKHVGAMLSHMVSALHHCPGAVHNMIAVDLEQDP